MEQMLIIRPMALTWYIRGLQAARQLLSSGTPEQVSKTDETPALLN